MFRPAIRIRVGFVFLLTVVASARVFALADEITNVTATNSSIQVELMGTRPVFRTDSFTSGGESYFLLSFAHAVLLGSPSQHFILPNRSDTVTAAQFSDHPYIVHILVNNRANASLRVVTSRQASARYLVTVDVGPRSRLKISLEGGYPGFDPGGRESGPSQGPGVAAPAQIGSGGLRSEVT